MRVGIEYRHGKGSAKQITCESKAAKKSMRGATDERVDGADYTASFAGSSDRREHVTFRLRP